MVTTEPVGVLDPRFSQVGAPATEWVQARAALRDAEVSWLTTVRPDSRPHVTPLLSVWVDEALNFVLGPTEIKTKNLQRNPHSVMTTGTNAFNEGLDVVVEGDSIQVSDEAVLRRLAEAYEAKYGSDWIFTVADGLFQSARGPAPVYRLVPARVFAFGKGEKFSQTRWNFDQG